MITRPNWIFPEPGDETHRFEYLATLLEVAFEEMEREYQEHGNTQAFFDLGIKWGRDIMLCLRDAASRYHDAGGRDFAPVQISGYELKGVVTETYLTEDPHFSVEIYRRSEVGREHYKLSVSTFEGMRDEAGFPPKLEASLKRSETLEIRYQVFLPWNRLATIERTEIKDDPEFHRPAIYASKTLRVTVLGKEI